VSDYIKVNTQSRMYRLYLLYNDPPKDLCEYMSGVIKSVLIFLFLTIAAVVILASTSVMVMIIFEIMVSYPSTALIISGVIVNGILLAMMFKQHNSAREPSPIKEWVKAKKSKYCPLVEVDGQ